MPASQRRARRLLGIVDRSGAPPASCGLWRPLIGGGGSAPPAGPRSVPGSQRVGAAIAMGTRDDEYDYLFKGTARARSPRRARGGAWPGPARPSRLRCPGPGVAAEAFVRGAALRAAPAAPGRGGAAWGWRWGDSGGAPRAFPSRRGGGCALAAGRARSGSAGEVRAWAGAGSGAGPPPGVVPGGGAARGGRPGGRSGCGAGAERT